MAAVEQQRTSQTIPLEGALGLDARISGGDAFGQLTGALATRLNSEPAFADVLQKFVDSTGSHGTPSRIRFNGKSTPEVLSEELLGKWVSLAAEHTLLDAKKMPGEADGARRIALEGHVARLEDAITLAHRGKKSVTVDERFIKIIADPTGDTQKRIADSLDGVTQSLSAGASRAAMKVLPVVIAGEMLFSSCTPFERPTALPALLAAGIEQSVESVGSRFSLMTEDGFTIPTRIMAANCSSQADSTQPMFIEFTGPSSKPARDFALCSVDVTIGSQSPVHGATFTEIIDGQAENTFLVFGSNSYTVSPGGESAQRFGELVLIQNGQAIRGADTGMTYDIAIDANGNVTGMDITGTEGPYHANLSGADVTFPAVIAQALGSILLQSDLHIATAAPTLTPTPTEIPIPQGLNTVPEGYSAVRNPDGTWGYGVGVDAKTSVPGLTVNASGAHFRLEGTTLDIPANEMKDRIQVGQTGALQIYDLDEYGVSRIQFAWDTKQEKWIRATDIRQPWRELIYDYITVQTREQLAALFDLEPLVMSPFPPDTYSWPLDKIIVDYNAQGNYDTSKDFSFYTPFGKVTDMAQSPFRFVNHILLEKGEGRKFDTYVLTEQVYNPADGTFSLLHFGFDNYGKTTPGFLNKGLSVVANFTDPPHILLPILSLYVTAPPPAYDSCNAVICNQLDFFIKNNYWKNGYLPEIQRLVEKWLMTGKVPEELTRFVNIPSPHYIMTRP